MNRGRLKVRTRGIDEAVTKGDEKTRDKRGKKRGCECDCWLCREPASTACGYCTVRVVLAGAVGGWEKERAPGRTRSDFNNWREPDPVELKQLFLYPSKRARSGDGQEWALWKSRGGFALEVRPLEV